jgi:hypothetical protein
VDFVVGGALPDDLYTELLGFLRLEVRIYIYNIIYLYICVCIRICG